MFIEKTCENKYFVIINLIMSLLPIIHLVFYFLIKEEDFEFSFEFFSDSPLFNFSIGKNCNPKSSIIFHEDKNNNENNIYKINGNLFCYKKIIYKYLLYNGQIIKKGEQCPQKYNKTCGTIDTLKQELCIKNEENCPLYDIGIGDPPNFENYEYLNESEGNIYYNKNTYNNPNKKIIGKLILNEGQPCYGTKEKILRKFINGEQGEENLQCKLEIFGKLNDNRYENKGNITYDKLYRDNLGNNFNMKEELKNKNVSLYKREFFGIDKKCDEEKDISYQKLIKNIIMEKKCLLAEAIICFILWLFLILICIICLFKSSHFRGIGAAFCFIYLICFLSLYLICIICQSIFIGRIIKYNLEYNCSDEITNEIIKKETSKTKKHIIYILVNFGLDVFFILFNIFALSINFFKEKCNECDFFNFPKIKKIKNNKNKNNQVNGISKAPKKEVVVNNEIPNLNNKQIGNNIINNNNNSMIPIATGLRTHPPILAGFNSNAKL